MTFNVKVTYDCLLGAVEFFLCALCCFYIVPQLRIAIKCYHSRRVEYCNNSNFITDSEQCPTPFTRDLHMQIILYST